MAKDKQAFDLDMYRRSIGAYGHAIIPEYGGDTEANMFNAARDNFQTQQVLLGSPGAQYTRYRNQTLPFSGAMDQGNQVVNGIFNGALTDERLKFLTQPSGYSVHVRAPGGLKPGMAVGPSDVQFQYQQPGSSTSGPPPGLTSEQENEWWNKRFQDIQSQPHPEGTRGASTEIPSVTQGRMDLAQTQKQGIYQGMHAQLNAAQAIQNKAGFVNDSSAARQEAYRTSIGAFQAAAAAQANAQLQNAQDIRQVQDAGQALKLQNLSLPYQRAQMNIAFDQIPYQQMNQNVMDAQAPFKFFNINPNAFRSDPALQIGATPSAAQIALTGIGAANAGVGNALLQNYMAKQYGANTAGGAAAMGGASPSPGYAGAYTYGGVSGAAPYSGSNYGGWGAGASDAAALA